MAPIFKLKYANPRSFKVHIDRLVLSSVFLIAFFLLPSILSFVFRSCRNVVTFPCSIQDIVSEQGESGCVTCIPRSFFFSEFGGGDCVIIIHPGCFILVSLRRKQLFFFTKNTQPLRQNGENNNNRIQLTQSLSSRHPIRTARSLKRINFAFLKGGHKSRKCISTVRWWKNK